MKKIIEKAFRLVFLLAFFGLAISFCKSDLAAQEEGIDIKAEIRKAAESKNRETLKAKEWTIYLTAKEGQKKAELQPIDILTFTDSAVSSKNLSEKGYPVSNYSLGIHDDGTAVWETMKSNKDGDLVFIRGELNDELMKGVFSLQPKKGSKSTYYFTTVKPEAMPEATQIEEPEPEPQKAKKKSRRW